MAKIPTSLFREAVAKAARFSLIRRNPDVRSIRIHRLVQEVLKDAMDQPAQCRYAKRVTDAVVTVFPISDYVNWPRCARLLANAQVAFELIKGMDLVSSAYAGFLNEVGMYLWARSRYDEAEPFLQLGLVISEKLPRTDALITSLNNLATVYREQNCFDEAERLFLKLLNILEAQGSGQNVDLARVLNSLGVLYFDQDRVQKAEPMLKRALAMRKKSLGGHHPDTATTLNILGLVYARQNRFKEAGPLLCRALKVREKVLGPNHPETGRSVAYLATFHNWQGLHKQAESLWRRALSIAEGALGANVSETHECAQNLAITLYNLHRDDEARIIKETYKIRS